MTINAKALEAAVEAAAIKGLEWEAFPNTAALAKAQQADPRTNRRWLDACNSARAALSSLPQAGVSPVPTYECDFRIGQPVRLAKPHPEMDPETVFYVTGIVWEHRMCPARGWNITVAGKDDIEKGYGQTDGYSPDDLLPARSKAKEG